jgi:hypothetical protein
MIKTLINQITVLKNITLTTLFLLTLSSCNSETKKEAASSTSDLMAAANELDNLFLVAFNNGDAEAIMKLHWNSPELRAYPPGEMQVNGFDEVKAIYEKDFVLNKGAKLEYTNANNIPFADGVVSHGTFRWTMSMENNEPMVFDGRYSEVKARKDVYYSFPHLNANASTTCRLNRNELAARPSGFFVTPQTL